MSSRKFSKISVLFFVAPLILIACQPKDFGTIKPDFSQLKNFPFSGKLTVHGIEKLIKGIVNISTDKDKLKIKAETKTTLDAHKIKTPGYMGITVADEVIIEVEFEAKLMKEVKKG